MRCRPAAAALGHQCCAELKCEKNRKEREQNLTHKPSVGEIANIDRDGSMRMYEEERSRG